MKTLSLVALVILSAGLCRAQDPQNPATDHSAPGVTIVENSWRRRVMRNPYPLSPDNDPILALENQDRAERRRSDEIRRNEIRTAAGKEPMPLPGRNAIDPVPLGPRPNPFTYIYRVKVNNTGAKKIRELVWEYVLTDSKDTEVGRHRFTSPVTVRPGKSKTIYGASTSPPATIVDANNAGDLSGVQHSGRVVIQAISYDDNSVWRRPSE